MNPTASIKCTFSNEVHKLLEPNINVKTRERWKHRDAYKLTDEQKIKLFDQILAIHNECSSLLSSYQYDKRQKKRVNKDRIARGWKPKKKTTKAEYLATQTA